MSEAEKPAQENGDPEPGRLSLTLLYSLIALALVVAIVCAVMIVLPFYKRTAL